MHSPRHSVFNKERNSGKQSESGPTPMLVGKRSVDVLPVCFFLRFWHFGFKYVETYLVFVLKVYHPEGSSSFTPFWRMVANGTEAFVRFMGIPHTFFSEPPHLHTSFSSRPNNATLTYLPTLSLSWNCI